MTAITQNPTIGNLLRALVSIFTSTAYLGAGGPQLGLSNYGDGQVVGRRASLLLAGRPGAAGNVLPVIRSRSTHQPLGFRATPPPP